LRIVWNSGENEDFGMIHQLINFDMINQFLSKNDHLIFSNFVKNDFFFQKKNAKK